jgi:hypothetical protein
MKRTVCRQLMPRREPERQVSPGRVTDEDHPLKIEVTRWCQLTDKVRGPGQVFVRSRPAAPIIPEATIFDIPRGNSIFCKRSG